MQYTENYDLVLIDGTDVISRVPHNESMTKIDRALGDMATDVSQAVTDVQNTKTQIEEENAQFQEDMETTLDETVAAINESVNNALASAPYYQLVAQLNLPRNMQICGETGNNVFPLSQSAFVKTRNMTVEGNRFMNRYTTPDTHYCRVSVDLVVGVDVDGTDFEIFLARYNGVTNEVNKTVSYTLDNGQNEIHFECILNMNSIDSGVQYRYIGFSSLSQLTLLDKANITIEYLGIDNV